MSIHSLHCSLRIYLLSKRNGSRFDPKLGNGKGVITKSDGISRISETLKSLRISRQWSSDSESVSLFSTPLGLSRISETFTNSRISREWTFLKRSLFQETTFSVFQIPTSPGLEDANAMKDHLVRMADCILTKDPSRTCEASCGKVQRGRSCSEVFLGKVLGSISTTFKKMLHLGDTF